jgi:adenine phosphoribosyltransferase
MEYVSLIRDVPDFPIEGILFKDITPLIGHGAAYRQVIDGLAGGSSSPRPWPTRSGSGSCPSDD